jgi:heat shock protein HslJ
MKTTTACLAALALGSTLAACSSPTPASEPTAAGAPPAAAPAPAPADGGTVTAPSTPADLVGRWILVAVDGAPVPELGRVPTLEIAEDGSAGGVGGVNRFRTQLQAADGRLAFGETAATKMAGPPAAMELEAAYLTRLQKVTGFTVEGGTLRLFSGEDELLRFTRTEE